MLPGATTTLAIRRARTSKVTIYSWSTRPLRAEYEQALQIGEAALGHDHPEVAVWHSNLGSVLADLGDLVGARAELDRAIQIGQATLGPDHRNVAIFRGNLDAVLEQLGE
jgi:hypothetical protein